MSYQPRFTPMQQQIIDAAVEIDNEEDYGYAPWDWSDEQFARIEALVMNEEAVQRSAVDWERMIEEAYEAALNDGDADLPGMLEIAQRVLER